LEAQKLKYMRENKQLQKESDTAIGQLKIIYENERQTMERRLNEERDAWNKKM